MKCPTCKSKFSIKGNSKEISAGVSLKCPECETSFELHTFSKFFPKGILLLLLVGVPAGFLPIYLGAPIEIIAVIVFIAWILKPENVSLKDEHANNT